MTILRPQQWTEAEVHRLRMLVKRKVSADSIAKSLGRYVGSVKTKARIASDPLQEAQGEEMTAPGPPWTPEKDRLLRSMGAAGESTAAIATLIKHSPHAVRKRARLLKIKLARSPPGLKAKG